jgi:hypothetical protein
LHPFTINQFFCYFLHQRLDLNPKTWVHESIVRPLCHRRKSYSLQVNTDQVMTQITCLKYLSKLSQVQKKLNNDIEKLGPTKHNKLPIICKSHWLLHALDRGTTKQPSLVKENGLACLTIIMAWISLYKISFFYLGKLPVARKVMPHCGPITIGADEVKTKSVRIVGMCPDSWFPLAVKACFEPVSETCLGVSGQALIMSRWLKPVFNQWSKPGLMWSKPVKVLVAKTYF